MRLLFQGCVTSALALAVAACASDGAAPAHPGHAGGAEAPIAGQAEPDLRVGSGASRAGAYFALFERQGNGSMRLATVSTSRPEVADVDRQEVLAFSADLTEVAPDYRTFIVDKESGTFECWTGLLRTRKDNATTDYNPCESALTKTVDVNAAFNVLATAVTAGAWALTGTSSRNVAVDPDRVLALVRETGVMQQLLAKRQASHQRWYQAAFSQARTAADYDAFIRQYANDDPDGLVPLARAMREQAAQREAVERQRKEIADAAARAQRAEEQAQQRRAVEERERLEQARVAGFRQSIRVGSETNCGPVLETRGDLVQVYFPVQGYGNEHWIRRGDAYPAGYGCRFYNGQYQPQR